MQGQSPSTSARKSKKKLMPNPMNATKDEISELTTKMDHTAYQ